MRRTDHAGQQLDAATAGYSQLDPLTHALSGIALARAIPDKPLRTGPFILLILLTMAPDTDYLLNFVSDLFYLQHHRGLTHSVLMLPLWTWLGWACVHRWQEKPTLSPLLIGAALLLHILLDLITSFGTMILAPLSDWRAALDLVYIIDPLFSACLLLPLLAGLFWKNRRRMLACLALILVCAYLVLAITAHQKALSIAHNAQPDATDVAALPMPFSPFHWQLIATYPDRYQRSAVNLWPGFTIITSLLPESFVQRYEYNLRTTDHLQWQQLRALHAAHITETLPGLAFYRWFARFPVILEQDAEHIECGDLRFAAAVPGYQSAFRLYIQLGDLPKAWLIWRDGHRSELTTASTPTGWLQ